MKIFTFFLTMIFAFQLSTAQSDYMRYQNGKFYINNSKVYTIKDVCTGETLTREDYRACASMRHMHEDTKALWRGISVMAGVTAGTYIYLINSPESLSFTRSLNRIILYVYSGSILGVLLGYQIIKSIRYRISRRNFIDGYNQSHFTNMGMELKLGATPNGVGLVLSF